MAGVKDLLLQGVHPDATAYLRVATRGTLGDLLTDVGTDCAPDVVRALGALAENVRPRGLS